MRDSIEWPPGVGGDLPALLRVLFTETPKRGDSFSYPFLTEPGPSGIPRARSACACRHARIRRREMFDVEFCTVARWEYGRIVEENLC
jgi:hypothetical protein